MTAKRAHAMHAPRSESHMSLFPSPVDRDEFADRQSTKRSLTSGRLWVLLVIVNFSILLWKIPDTIARLERQVPADLRTSVGNEELLATSIAVGAYMGCGVYVVVLAIYAYAANRFEAKLSISPLNLGGQGVGPLFLSIGLTTSLSLVLGVQKFTLPHAAVASLVLLLVFALFCHPHLRHDESLGRLGWFVFVGTCLAALI